jgi:DNA mismatch endonuclease (patch repair protein)
MTSWPKSVKHEKTTFGGLSRSVLMSRIRSSRNATTELRFLSLLRIAHIKGWRWNYPLAGKPDFTFPKEKLVVFVDGCFWHGHNCRNLTPKNNGKAWGHKIQRNRQRDSFVRRNLKIDGWRVIRIWECSLAKRPDNCVKRVMRVLAQRDHPRHQSQ